MQYYRAKSTMREELTRYILAASVVAISAAVSTAIARMERTAFVATTSEKVMLRPPTALGADVGSATLSGSSQPTATRGGTISVYGTEASPLNSSYGGDVHIFSGGNPTSGYGQVWLGVTVEDPELGVVPQDVIGLQNDRSIDMLSYSGLRIHPSKTRDHLVTVHEGAAGPIIELSTPLGQIDIELSGNTLHFRGDVSRFQFSSEVSAPAIRLQSRSAEGRCSSGEIANDNGELVACDDGQWRAVFAD